MFSKTDQTSAAPVPATRASAGKSILGSDLVVTGNVSSLGDVDVHGQIEGTVAARMISVGSGGTVSGSITAQTLEIHGQMDGQISAGTLTLRADGNVNADVSYGTLVIESGAQIEGRFALNKG